MMRRRQFLLNSVAAASLLGGASTSRGETPEKLTLSPADHPTFRIKMQMDLRGNVHLADNELVSNNKDRQVPIKYSSVLDYDERRVAGESSGVWRGARRYYHVARSEGTTAASPNVIELRESARQVACHLSPGRGISYAEDAYLTHEEVELLEIPLCSAVVDNLIPRQALQRDQTFRVDDEALRQFLDLDGLQESDVEGKLVKIDDEQARFELQGSVQGSVAGVPTQIDIASKLTFDIQQRCCTWVAMGLRERREIGKAEPGFEISATIKMLRKPIASSDVLVDKPLPEEPPETRLLVNLYSPTGNYGVLMDRRWQMITQSNSLSTLRMVKDDRDIAQCNVSHLSPLKPGQQLTLEGLQADLKRSMGKNFREFTQATQEANQSGIRILRLQALGAVQGVPVHWVFAHCSDDSGQRILATFTMAAERMEQFSGADEQFVQSLRFLQIPPDATESPQGIDPEAAAKPPKQALLNRPENGKNR